jgi:hypothetical protein
VLTNQDGRSGLDAAITNRALDTWMGWPLRDGSTALVAQRRAEDALPGQVRALDSARVKGTSPLPLEKYVGTYTDEMYGDVTIALENGALTIKSNWDPQLHGKLNHWHYNEFRIEDRPDFRLSATSFVSFVVDQSANVSGATLTLGEPVTFKKVAPAAGRGGRGGRGGGA